jgi:hypothetical protein
MDTVVPTPAADVLPVATSELVAEPERRRRPWWPLALYAVSGLLVAGAVAVTVSAERARDSAADSADRTTALMLQQSEAHKSAAVAEATHEELVAQVRVVEQALQDWDAASDRYLNARDAFVAAGNAAIDLGNAGDVEGAVERFEGEVSDRLADLEPLIVTVEDGQTELAAAVRRLDRLVDDLKEVSR